MAGEGVILIDDSTGNYGSAQDLFDHLGDLIGQSLTATINADGGIELPAMSITQTGTTVRLYEDSTGVATWAPENSRSLIWDALTDREGKIRLNGTVALDFFGSGVGCDGTDTKSFDSGSATGLDAEQCSTAGTRLGGQLPNDDCLQDFGRKKCFVLSDSATTFIETGFDTYFTAASPRFRCKITPGTTECDTTSSSGFTRVRQLADSMEIMSEVHKNGSLDFTPPNVTGNSVNELLYSTNDGNGICSEGEVEKNSIVLTLQTRDGSYDSGRLQCTF